LYENEIECFMHRRRSPEAGFTLLEVLIAAVVVVVLALAFLGSVVASFMADTGSHNSNAAVNAARQTMEEVMELAFGDVLALDGDTAVTSDGLAVRISVVQSTVSLALVEGAVCRPVSMVSVCELQAMSLEEFKRLGAAQGSKFSLVTMKHKP